MKKSITISIIAFWLVMMGLLFMREVLPGIRNALMAEDIGAGYDVLLQDAKWETTRRFGIYYGNQRLGETFTVIRPQNQSWLISNHINITSSLPTSLMQTFGGAGTVPSAGGTGGIQASSQAVIGSDFKLVSISAWVRREPSMDNLATLEGKVVGRKLIITLTDMAGGKQNLEMPFESGNIMTGGPGGPLTFPQPDIGRRWRTRIVHPLTLRLETSYSEVTGQQTIDIDGEARDAYIVETTWAGMKMKSYIDRTGELLLQETPVGLRLVRESPAAGLPSGHQRPDVDATTSNLGEAEPEDND